MKLPVPVPEKLGLTSVPQDNFGLIRQAGRSLNISKEFFILPVCS